MAKLITENDITMAICYSLMNTWQFDYARRLRWEVWSAKQQLCVVCSAQVNTQCMNLGDLRRNASIIKKNKRPHPERVNWNLLLEGLKMRGYYRPQIEQQVRARVIPR